MTSSIFLDSTTLNQLFTSASVIATDTTYTHTSSGSEFFIYKLPKNVDNSYDATLTFSENFAGRVEVYNNDEFLRVFYTLNGGVSIEDQYLYSINSTYYDNEYNAYYPSEPVAVEELTKISVQTTEDTVAFNTIVASDQDVYVMIVADPGVYTFTSSFAVLQMPVIEPPEIPTEPDSMSRIVISGPGSHELAFTNDKIAAYLEPINLQLIGSITGAVKINYSYGTYSGSTGYIYDPSTVDDLTTLQHEIDASEGYNDVPLTPIIDNQLLSINLNTTGESNFVFQIDSAVASASVDLTLNISSANGVPIGDNDKFAYRRTSRETGVNNRRRRHHLGYF